MRWWFSYALLYFGLLAFVAAVLVPILDLPPFWSVAIAAIAYPFGVQLGLLPPGRPSATAAAPAPPVDADPSERRLLGRRSEFDDDESAWRPRFLWLGGLVLLAFLLGLLSWAVVSPWLDGDEGPRRAAAPEATATATLTATLSPTRTPSPSPTATSTPTPEPTPEPTATPVPATPTSTPSTPVAQSAPPLTGQWEVVDTVTFGQDTGSTFRFTVALVQSGNNVTGSGSGLSLQGTRSGDAVRLDFVRDGNKTGYFAWAVQPNGSLAGTFEDYGAANGGTSTGTRQ